MDRFKVSGERIVSDCSSIIVEFQAIELKNRYQSCRKSKVCLGIIYRIFRNYFCFVSFNLCFKELSDSYIEGRGLTDFLIISEYVISLILVCSLVLLYLKRDRFENHVFRLLTASIVLTIISEIIFARFTYVDDFRLLPGTILNYCLSTLFTGQ